MITVAEFRTATIATPANLDQLETRRPGFIAVRIAMRSAEINGKLAKRYATPFATPAPTVVVLWLVQLVTADCYQALGYDPSSAQDAQIIDEATKAASAINEAADAVGGLYELPLRADLPGSDGVTRGSPFGYSEPSPYEWIDEQARAVRGG